MNTAARLLEPIKEAADDDSPMSPEIASRVVRLFANFARLNMSPHLPA